jgi:hypothetical protein
VTSNVRYGTYNKLQHVAEETNITNIPSITCVRAEPRKGKQATTRPREKKDYFDALFLFYRKYFLP